MQPRIFISYASADALVARRLAAGLEQAGMAPWIDQKEIRPGDSFIAKMNEAIAQSSYLLLLVSRASAGSHWVSREWMSAVASREVVIIPVLLDDSEVPTLLGDPVHVDIRQDFDLGLSRLIAFFGAETSARGKVAVVRGFSLKNASRRQLRLVAVRCLDESALAGFCFDAEIEPGRLAGQSLNERLVSLLHVVATEGLVSQFAEW